MSKFYVLEMFPYPSGNIHMGHVRNYVIGDVLARHMKSLGYDVVHPMGWDAFGLPAENAAKKYNVHPKEWTYSNITSMKEDLKKLNLMIDWDREVITCDPEYFRFEQELFIDMFNNDLAYQKESLVNWDPVDQTVLANEQVIDGKGWRSGAKIEQKNLKQWFLRITNYQDELYNDLDNLTGWPEKVRTMQKNWIKGRDNTLRDWGISRQRYWGCPIPIIYLEDGSIIPVPKEDLPVTLPDDVDFSLPGNPLDNHPTWKYVTLKDGRKGIRETDTMDTFMESSWYFIRYCSPKASQIVDKDIAKELLPVDQYIGGVEHAILHLLYARFLVKVMRDLGYIDISEPFINLMTQGMVKHKTFKNSDGDWVLPTDVTLKDGKLFDISGLEVTVGPSEKMSKSKLNVVNPVEYIDQYGSDAVRMYILSDSPPDIDFEWTDTGMKGSKKFLNRLTNFVDNYNPGIHKSEKLNLKMKQTQGRIEDSFKRFHFNKVIAALREFYNHIEEAYKKDNTLDISDHLMMILDNFEAIIPETSIKLKIQLGINL